MGDTHIYKKFFLKKVFPYQILLRIGSISPSLSLFFTTYVCNNGDYSIIRNSHTHMNKKKSIQQQREKRKYLLKYSLYEIKLSKRERFIIFRQTLFSECFKVEKN